MVRYGWPRLAFAVVACALLVACSGEEQQEEGAGGSGGGGASGGGGTGGGGGLPGGGGAGGSTGPCTFSATVNGEPWTATDSIATNYQPEWNRFNVYGLGGPWLVTISLLNEPAAPGSYAHGSSGVKMFAQPRNDNVIPEQTGGTLVFSRVDEAGAAGTFEFDTADVHVTDGCFDVEFP